MYARNAYVLISRPCTYPIHQHIVQPLFVTTSFVLTSMVVETSVVKQIKSNGTETTKLNKPTPRRRKDMYTPRHASRCYWFWVCSGYFASGQTGGVGLAFSSPLLSLSSSSSSPTPASSSYSPQTSAAAKPVVRSLPCRYSAEMAQTVTFRVFVKREQYGPDSPSSFESRLEERVEC